MEAAEGFVKQKPMRRRLLEPTKDKSNDVVSKKMVRAGKILERMVNQNSCFEIAHGSINIIHMVFNCGLAL